MTKRRTSRAKTAAAPAAASRSRRRPVASRSSAISRGLLKSLGSHAGGAIGSIFGPSGATLGSRIGGSAGAWLGNISGLGEYKLQENSLLGYNTSGPPSFGDDAVIIAHREYLADISSAGSKFNAAQYTINPGNSATFPWLSSVAQNFQEYRFLGLVFEFKSTSGYSVGSTNTALGTLIMSTQYDVLAAPFIDKISMDSYQYTTSGGPYSNILHGVECKPSCNVLSNLYVGNLNGSAPLLGDPHLYDLGNFFIATQGQQAVSDLGELWVSYKIALMKPKLPTAYGAYAHFSEGPAGTAAVASSRFFGTSGGILSSGSTLTSTQVSAKQIAAGDTNGIYIKAPGIYVVMFAWSGTVTTSSYPTIATGTNLVFIPLIADLADSQFACASNGNSVAVGVVTCNQFTSLATNILYVVSGNAGLAAGTADCLIFQISGDPSDSNLINSVLPGSGMEAIVHALRGLKFKSATDIASKLSAVSRFQARNPPNTPTSSSLHSSRDEYISL